MKMLKKAHDSFTDADGDEAIKAAHEEQRAREELIKDLVGSLKKVYHGDLNVSIHLHRINEKLNKIGEVEI